MSWLAGDVPGEWANAAESQNMEWKCLLKSGEPFVFEKILHNEFHGRGHASMPQNEEGIFNHGRRRVFVCAGLVLPHVSGRLGLALLDRLFDGGVDLLIGDKMTVQKVHLSRCPSHGIDIEALSAVLS